MAKPRFIVKLTPDAVEILREERFISQFLYFESSFWCREIHQDSPFLVMRQIEPPEDAIELPDEFEIQIPYQFVLYIVGGEDRITLGFASEKQAVSK